MTMRVELTFPRPLSAEERTRLLLAVSALACAKRVSVARTGYSATVHGEALGVRQLEAALSEARLTVESIRSSLVEELEEGMARESFAPPGRTRAP